MRQTARALAACLAIALFPSSAFAWGSAAHRYIMRRAIDLLPPELKPFFVQNRDEIVLRVIDPDLWRSVGWAEAPNHFVDFGIREYGPYPFTALPRDYGAALEKFGRPTLERNGLLPWREEEIFGNLRRAFEAMEGNAPYAVSDVVVFSAVAAHYMQDAYQPLHATDNFDGARTDSRASTRVSSATCSSVMSRACRSTRRRSRQSPRPAMRRSTRCSKASGSSTRSSRLTGRRSPAGTCTTTSTSARSSRL